jgi:hypothetical protein
VVKVEGVDVMLFLMFDVEASNTGCFTQDFGSLQDRECSVTVPER